VLIWKAKTAELPPAVEGPDAIATPHLHCALTGVYLRQRARQDPSSGTLQQHNPLPGSSIRVHRPLAGISGIGSRPGRTCRRMNLNGAPLKVCCRHQQPVLAMSSSAGAAWVYIKPGAMDSAHRRAGGSG